MIFQNFLPLESEIYVFQDLKPETLLTCNLSSPKEWKQKDCMTELTCMLSLIKSVIIQNSKLSKENIRCENDKCSQDIHVYVIS